MKMHKCEITLSTLVDGKLKPINKVTGLCSANFGMNKLGNTQYVVTHLPTGLSMCGVENYHLARKIISQLETEVFPVAWAQVTIHNSKQNAQQAKEIISTCRKEYWYA